MLDPQLTAELRAVQAHLDADGRLTGRAQLGHAYDTFRQRFGPERLLALDGEVLLSTMHDLGNRDSLVYWLEFKNDAEFPGVFGSIAGGSALKFGLYRRRETGAWMTGAAQNQRELTVDEAIELARRHRDELARAAAALDQLPDGAGDAEYAALQTTLDAEASAVSDSAWGHKYLSLLYPTRLDDFHNADFQHFHLIKLLQVPPEGAGRYRAGGRYVAVAAELGLPQNHLMTILHERNGRPHRYWRLVAKYKDWQEWPAMLNEGFAGRYWPYGDLTPILQSPKPRAALRAVMREHQDPGQAHLNVYTLLVQVKEGDIIVATEGRDVLGVGRVTGGYVYDPTAELSQQRPVAWVDAAGWRLPDGERFGSTMISELVQPTTQVVIERGLLGAPPIAPQPHPARPRPPQSTPRLDGIPGRIQAVLERKQQVILYGPPGTGKTHWALLAARDLAAHARFGAPFGQLAPEQQEVIQPRDGDGGLVRLCTFHPAYGYEDFLEGYRPRAEAGALIFERRDGLFRQLCRDAAAQPDHSYYLIIDEINRGDIPRIFGELLTVMEKSKRGQPVLLPLSAQPFAVPGNVYLIGTMNTADRSIALLDTALRRRFGFVELMPDGSVLGTAAVAGIPLRPWLDALNQRICEALGRDARHLQIGHAYLMDGAVAVGDTERFVRIVQDDIVPLLEEYCYEDFGALVKILGAGLIDERNQQVRHELFQPANQERLVQALLAIAPEIGTSAQAVAADAAAGDDPADLPDDDAESEPA